MPLLSAAQSIDVARRFFDGRREAGAASVPESVWRCSPGFRAALLMCGGHPRSIAVLLGGTSPELLAASNAWLLDATGVSRLARLQSPAGVERGMLARCLLRIKFKEPDREQLVRDSLVAVRSAQLTPPRKGQVASFVSDEAPESEVRLVTRTQCAAEE